VSLEISLPCQVILAGLRMARLSRLRALVVCGRIRLSGGVCDHKVFKRSITQSLNGSLAILEVEGRAITLEGGRQYQGTEYRRAKVRPITDCEQISFLVHGL